MAFSRTKGGAGPYRKGANYERMVKKQYEKAGWLVVRSPKSGSPMDLTAMTSNDSLGLHSRVQLIQCKLGGYMSPAERKGLIDLARSVAGEPILAWGKPVRRKNLNTGRELAPLA